jgi:hypothetical protein
MNATGKAVALVCIFSTLFTGCYSSTLIDPDGDGKDRIHSEGIEYVVMKDGQRYDFVVPPYIKNGAIVGPLASGDSVEVSLPLSEVKDVCVSEIHLLPTIGAALLVALAIEAGMMSLALSH